MQVLFHFLYNPPGPRTGPAEAPSYLGRLSKGDYLAGAVVEFRSNGEPRKSSHLQKPRGDEHPLPHRAIPRGRLKGSQTTAELLSLENCTDTPRVTSIRWLTYKWERWFQRLVPAAPLAVANVTGGRAFLRCFLHGHLAYQRSMLLEKCAQSHGFRCKIRSATSFSD